MKKVSLYEIAAGTPGYREQFEIVPERPFVLPGGGRIELRINAPDQKDEIWVYGKDGKLTDRVAVKIIPTSPDKEQIN